ncbi:protein-glutamine gamma-glutamyltransferase [Paenibacillus sp.]|uniref:protein-glutamine gamma-glutamyltransferase n=1 Tax=Paenibacillus sp. TaxID=58172 RepID=UPI002D4EB0DF|nr:protein-glutamine gamma-glutamyltransferase [Paenibacillus sp.]HZG83880.1 protein-glutamine gamma-glutamyltransferase [Paenibacillus sp.]
MIRILEGADAVATSEGSDVGRALLRLISGGPTAQYPRPAELNFELRLREATMRAALELNGSGAAFETFENSRCNPEYWRREPNGAFRLRADRRPAGAIRDIFANGPMYGFECATAIVIVFYKAVLDSIGDAAYDRLFANTYLFHWNVDRDLGLTTIPTVRYIPGDCLYFDNPDVNPETMQWQGENVIDLGGDRYYGHGIGIRNAKGMIEALNAHRRPGATRSAYLLPQATRPDYIRLSLSAGSPFGDALPPGLPFRARIGHSLYMYR